MNHEMVVASTPSAEETGAGMIEREVTLLGGLKSLTAYREKTQTQIEAAFQKQSKQAEREFAEASQQLAAKFKTQYAALEKEYKHKLETIASTFESDYAATKDEMAETQKAIEKEYAENKERVTEEFEQAIWEAKSLYEAAVNAAAEARKDGKNRREQGTKTIKKLRDDSKNLLLGCGMLEKVADAIHLEDRVPESEDPLEDFEKCISEAESQLETLRNIKTLKRVKAGPIFGISFGIFVVLAGALWFVLGPALALVAGVVVAGVAGSVIRMNFVKKAKAEIIASYQPMLQNLADAEKLRNISKDKSAKDYERSLQEAKERIDQEKEQLTSNVNSKLADLKQRRDQELASTNEDYPRRLSEIEAENASSRAKAKEYYPAKLADLKKQYEQHLENLKKEQHERLTGHGSEYDKCWTELIDKWKHGITQARNDISYLNGTADKLFPAWGSDAWKEWIPPKFVPRVMPLGSLAIDMEKMPGGVPNDERLPLLGSPQFDLPALIHFPSNASLLIKASGQGKEKAEQTLQALMFRYLTAVPPGKIRFTIIDPVGLGQSFSAFMHLADYEEQLVTNRIWTESGHIDQRLRDLTAHMENVIQAYLRNQYETIEEYNEEAGEVAEPFRVLVVANFPVNFTDAAARRLVSVAASGARCGVHTLITVDEDQPLPQGFNLADLEQHCVCMNWGGQRLLWADPNFSEYPLTVEAPPPPNFVTQLMHVVGKKAKEASRVEVPFEFIAPAENEWWTGDSRGGIKIALGQAGATKRQFLELGKGTSQHVLTAGKTGSGKSTLLHVLVTNMALTYSPQEMEVYLLDFKKGVEFKTYATHKLPHARVIAIESEREFGLSVMQRLDVELKRRGDLFREVGAQDIKSYRNAVPEAVMPRILFVVDEFQELFVEDDKISQDASLLLDRLVRQGRAFGIHVFLGSQTLGGAYSLARTTIDQMGVRIALQCSEADAHLILSEDNSAARLLTRPGEAIYNDANGMVEGNNPFQVVWISDAKREQYLQECQRLLQERGITPEQQIVFEGNIPADPSKNVQLNRLLQASAWPHEVSRAPGAWLGDAVAIKDPTCALYPAESGTNMLIIGRDEEAALAIMASSMISLAAQLPPTLPGSDQPAVQFYLFDGTPADSPIAGQLAKVGAALPHKVRNVERRELAAAMQELSKELERRQGNPEAIDAPIFIFIYNLSRYRDLRKSDDDFGFGRSDEPASPSKMFGTLVQEGASLGMHVIVWGDSLNNINRSIDRQMMREFELRVLFQMSATDSSNLIDSPAAGRLGNNRALLHSEELGQYEKFRPYGVPDDEWLDRVRSYLFSKLPKDDNGQPIVPVFEQPALEAAPEVNSSEPEEDTGNFMDKFGPSRFSSKALRDDDDFGADVADKELGNGDKDHGASDVGAGDDEFSERT